MASGKTDALELHVLNHFLKGTAAVPQPTALKVALYTVAPTESAAGTEITGTGYTVGGETIAFAAAGAGTISNSGTITWTAGAADWTGPIVGHAILADGVAWYYEDSIAGPTLGNGDTYEFAIGDFDINEL